MKKSEVKRFAALYERHLKLLKLQGKSKSTIAAYSRAVRRIRNHEMAKGLDSCRYLPPIVNNGIRLYNRKLKMYTTLSCRTASAETAICMYRAVQRLVI